MKANNKTLPESSPARAPAQDWQIGRKTVFLALLLIWACTFLAYFPILGAYKTTQNLWLSCSTVVFAGNWMALGPLSIAFAMLTLPKSVDAPTLSAMGVYASYPPGAVLPVWALAQAFSLEPKLWLVRAWNLSVQGGVSLCMAGFAWNALRALGRRAAFLGAMAAGAFYLLSRVPGYFHFSAYFSDQAVLLPVAALLFFEVSKKGKAGILAISLLCLWGALTDPLMYFAGGGVMAVRLAQGFRQGKRLAENLRSVAYIAVPLLLGLALFAWQIVALGQLPTLWETLARRMYAPAQPGEPLGLLPIFHHYRKDAFLPVMFCLVFGAAAMGWKNRAMLAGKIKGLGIAGAYFAAILLHTFVFLNHSVVHPFSVMKYYVGFGILLGLGIGILSALAKRAAALAAAASIACLLLSFGLGLRSIYGQTEYDLRLDNFVRQNSSFSTVWVSPVYSIEAYPPIDISVSKKQIHRVENSCHIDPQLLALDKNQYGLHYVVPADFFPEEKLGKILLQFPQARISKQLGDKGGFVDIGLPRGIGIQAFAQYIDKLEAKPPCAPGAG